MTDEPSPSPNSENTKVSPGEITTVDVRDPDDIPLQPPGDFSNGEAQTIEVNLSLLDENDRLAEVNRERFKGLGLRVLNLVSSPGAGKTTLLARTLESLAPDVRCGVLVGDLETDNDAKKLRHSDVPVAQITTGSACHLDASMIQRGVDAFDLGDMRFLFIENVGNLVCPASFDLGETIRVALLSCTEGEDKPLKYPPIYKSAHVILLTKTDLADAADFDCATALENVRKIAPQAKVFEISSKSGEGLDVWLGFLRSLN